VLQFSLSVIEQHRDEFGSCQSLSEINKWSVLVYLESSAVCARLSIVLNDPMVTRPCIIPSDKVQHLV
jgi:hypothetical protein